MSAATPQQQQAIDAVGNVLVVAGAGTGKTRAITHRIAYGVHSGVYAPQQVLAVTFTTRAAGEMRGRLRELGVSGVQARTFHSAARDSAIRAEPAASATSPILLSTSRGSSPPTTRG